MGNQFLGRADTSVKLETPRTIFSQSFDGTSNIGGQALVYGTGSDTNRYSSGGLQVRESALVATAQSDDRYAPRIGFHWANRVGNNLIMTSTGLFRFTTSNDVGLANVQADTFIGALQGNATSSTTATTATQANKWTTARSIVLTGNASGSVSLDGSANVSLSVSNNYATSSDNANYLNVPDTRGTNVAPKDLTRSVKFEFKSHSIINNPYGDDTYNGLMSAAFYGDASGGNRYQIAFGSDMGTIPYLSMRTNTGGATSWGDWALIPTMNQANGYWGFKFPTDVTYLRTPLNGLLPDSAGNPSTSVLGTSSWRFKSAYINEIYGTLYGNAATATNATQLGGVGASGYLRTTGGTLSGVTAAIARAGSNASWVTGRNYAPFKTTTGAVNQYSPIWSCKTGAGSWECGSYSNNDLYFTYISDTDFSAGTNKATAQLNFGVDGNITALKFTGTLVGNADTATTATNSNQLGGVAAASYINTTDTLILRGTV